MPRATRAQPARSSRGLPVNDRARVDFSTVRGTQFLEPLFEFSGACAGCGETPYLKLITQLFGDRMLVANATGCSSIYGGNLPTTPWTKNDDGRGPAWSNSLFEDNAEFGLGFRLAVDQARRGARCELARALASRRRRGAGRGDPRRAAADESCRSARSASGSANFGNGWPGWTDEHAKQLLSVVDHLVRRSVWIVGGDGWAYDIGSAGSTTCWPAGATSTSWCSTPRSTRTPAARCRRPRRAPRSPSSPPPASAVGKKDLALQAMSYGNVYVARVAMGANPQQTLRALREAEAYQGPSLIIAYSHCIAHGINMSTA